MDMDNERNGYVIETGESIGEVKIANDVVAMIAGLAALEIDGVHAMSGKAKDAILGKVGVKNLAAGAKVTVENGVVSVEMSVILKYGYNIPDTSKQIQERVKSAIETMTGLEVSDVNIRIADVNIEK